MFQGTRLNGAIAALEAGHPVFGTFVTSEHQTLIQRIATPYDVVIFDSEHSQFDPAEIRNGLAHLLDRRSILERQTLAPTVTPFIRLAANGCEMNQWQAKQALDLGVYGLIWPRISTVAEARNAVQASRYPRPEAAPHYNPPGLRGFGPSRAARYWGLSVADYHGNADTWPLNPDGEVLVVVMCEDAAAVRNLPDILEKVPGIGAVLIGTADLAVDLGHLSADHPDVQTAVDSVLVACGAAGVACGTAGVNASNIEENLERGFRLLLTGYTDDDAIAIGIQWVTKNLR